MSLPPARSAVLSLAAALLLVGAADAQRGSDLLDQYKNRAAVEAQRFENEIRDTVAEATKLALTDPGKAVEVLKAALPKVDANEALTASRRESMARDLRERIRVIEADARRAASAADEEAKRKAQGLDVKTAQQRDAAEQAKVSRLLDQVKSLRDQGRNDEAARLTAELRQKYPDNPAVLLAGRSNATTDSLNEYYRVLNERERRLLAARLDVDRSAMPPSGDIEFPSPEKWREITKLRKNTQPLTDREKAILQALDTPITLDFKDVKLAEFLQYLQDKLGLPVQLDKASLDQLMINDDTSVSIRARQFSTRTVLRKVLADLGLTYVVKDEEVQAMTPDRARSLMTTRVYYIGDLVGTFDMRLPPVLNQLQMAQNVAGLMDYITKNVDPDSWAINERGGLGSIVFDPIRGALIVKQSAEVHYYLNRGIR